LVTDRWKPFKSVRHLDVRVEIHAPLPNVALIWNCGVVEPGASGCVWQRIDFLARRTIGNALADVLRWRDRLARVAVMHRQEVRQLRPDEAAGVAAVDHRGSGPQQLPEKPALRV
jgi:hypothetical protein